ncbi:MAG: hypothetical protein GY810_28145 [Aureispira sp.]|nr:hypothetical protein [Aureispira sp.]
MTKRLIYLLTLIFIGGGFTACETVSEETGGATIIANPEDGLRTMEKVQKETVEVSAEHLEAFNVFSHNFGAEENTIAYETAQQFIMTNLANARNYTENKFDRTVDAVEYGEDVPYMYWYGQKVFSNDDYSLMTYHWEADLGMASYTIEFLASFSADGKLIDRIPFNGDYSEEKGGFTRNAECAGTYNKENHTIAVNWTSSVDGDDSSTEYNDKVYSVYSNGEFVIVADEIKNRK